MILFEAIRTNLALCLYCPKQTRSFGAKRLMVSLTASLIIASNVAFVFLEADRMEEYVFAAYFTTTGFGIFGSFIHTCTETATMFVLIDSVIVKVVEKGVLRKNTL